MAKRITLTQNADIRSKIKTGMLIKRLEDHAEGLIHLENSQVKAAQILLAKTTPDLSTVTLEGNKDKPLQTALPPHDQDLISRYLQQKKDTK